MVKIFMVQGGAKNEHAPKSRFRDPQKTPSRPSYTKPSLPRPIGGVLFAVLESGGRDMAVLVSNLGTQNRDFTVLIWVPKLLTSPSGMVRFHSQVKRFRARGVR